MELGRACNYRRSATGGKCKDNIVRGMAQSKASRNDYRSYVYHLSEKAFAAVLDIVYTGSMTIMEVNHGDIYDKFDVLFI